MKFFMLVALIFYSVLFTACTAPYTTPTSQTQPALPLLIFGELIKEGEEATWINESGSWKPATAIIDGEEKTLSSAYFKKDTYLESDEHGAILLVFEFNETGSRLSKKITSRLIGKSIGLFLGDECLRGVDGKPIAPIIRSPIIEKGQIEGLSLEEATTLSDLLNAAHR